MAFEIGPGSGSAGVSLIGAGLIVIFPTQRWLGFLLIGVGLLVFLFDVRFERGHVKADGLRIERLISGRFDNARRMIAFYGMIICGIGFLGFATAYFWPQGQTPLLSPPTTTPETVTQIQAAQPKPLPSSDLANTIRTIYPPPPSVGSAQKFLSLSPDELVHPYRTHTQQQANKETAFYLGKWLLIEGPVWDITPTNRVTLDHLWPSVGVILQFSIEWAGQLLATQKGDKIVAACQIDQVTSDTVFLKDCRLITTPITESPPAPIQQARPGKT